MDFLLYITLAASVGLYAVLLHHFKELLEPDLTWLEVVIGCTICLGFAAWRHRLIGGDWHEYERGVWWAFLVGGGVIIVWQVGRFVQRQKELQRRGISDAAALAEERRSHAPGND
jgi:hypothetical protein